MSKKKKIILWSAGIFVSLIVIFASAIYISSVSAVSAFRGDASAQLNPIVSGNKLDDSAPVQLANIPLADTINPTYKKVKNTQNSYAKLLSDARNYSLAKKWQDALAAIYNANSSKDAPISVDILTSVNSYLSVLKSGYSGENSRITEMQNLANTVASSTTFSQVNDALANTIQDNSAWLNGLRDTLNTEIVNFQKAVN